MLINNLQKGQSDANREAMGGGSSEVRRLKSWTVLYFLSFSDLKESLVHPRRIVQIVPVGNTIQVLMNSEPFLPG